MARRVSCVFTGSGENIKKSIVFRPFRVDMLEVQEVPGFAGDSTVDCWMAIQRGEYPNVRKKYIAYINIQ